MKENSSALALTKMPGSRAASPPIPTRRRICRRPSQASSGARGALLKSDRKVSVTLRLDRDIVERFKADRRRLSDTCINAALKTFRARLTLHKLDVPDGYKISAQFLSENQNPCYYPSRWPDRRASRVEEDGQGKLS